MRGHAKQVGRSEDDALMNVLQVLAAGAMSPGDVDMVLLVGRATRMPRVHGLLAEHFGRGPSILSYAVRLRAQYGNPRASV